MTGMTKQQIARIDQLCSEAFVNGLESDEVNKLVEGMIAYLERSIYGEPGEDQL